MPYKKHIEKLLDTLHDSWDAKSGSEPPLPDGINQLMPVSLTIPRKRLAKLLAKELQRLGKGVLADDPHDASRLYLLKLERLLAWVSVHPWQHILVSLYPESTLVPDGADDGLADPDEHDGELLDE